MTDYPQSSRRNFLKAHQRLFLDHYGVIGLTKVSANPLRIAGVVLVIIGVSFVAYANKK